MIDITGLIERKSPDNSDLPGKLNDGLVDLSPVTPFSGILEQSMAAVEPLQTGTILPEKAQKLSPDYEDDTRSAPINVITIGDTPSQADIVNFAMRQGINPDAIKVLMFGNNNPAQPLTMPDVPLGTPSAQLEINDSMLEEATSNSLTALREKSAPLVIPSRFTSLSEGRFESSKSSELKHKASSLMALTTSAQSIMASLGSSGAKIKVPEQVSSSPKLAATSTHISSAEAGRALEIPIKQISKVGSKINEVQRAGVPSESTTAKQTQSEIKLSLAADRIPLAPTNTDMQIRVVPVKLSLTDPVLERLVLNGNNSLVQSNAAAPMAQVSVDDPRASVKQPLSQPLGPDLKQIADYISESIGKRVVAQMAKGEWKIELELHPRSLGRIEVQLELKNGDIEATFTTNNTLTRELLNEGLPRLRHALEEGGTENALLDLELANGEGSDDKLTQNEERDEFAELAEPEAAVSEAANTSDEGLNIFI